MRGKSHLEWSTVRIIAGDLTDRAEIDAAMAALIGDKA